MKFSLCEITIFTLHRQYYGHMTRSPDMYSDHMMMTPELCQANEYRPSMSDDQPSAHSYMSTVSYSLDHLDRLDYQVSPVCLPPCLSVCLPL